MYEYGRIAKLDEKLREAKIDPDVIGRIMAGGEAIRKSAAPEKKAAWLGEAMRRMERLLPPPVCRAVREACACCLGGKRLEIVRGITRQHDTLADRIKAANEAKLVFGHSVARQEDGRVLVCFQPEGEAPYRCPCLPKAEEHLPITYCYCCGGHVKHHLGITLGRELAVEVRSSVLSSGGQEPCRFVLALKGSGS